MSANPLVIFEQDPDVSKAARDSLTGSGWRQAPLSTCSLRPKRSKRRRESAVAGPSFHCKTEFKLFATKKRSAFFQEVQ